MPIFTSAEVNQMRLHVLPTKQFKTFSIAMYIGIPLALDTITSTALTAYVWRRGNASYPETRQFRERLDDLYGAGFGFDVIKRGDYQIITLRMDIVNDAFVSNESSSLLHEALRFLAETVYSPVLDDGIFRASYVASEKMTLRKRIEAVINNKMQYAAERCMAEMCKDEPYRLFPLGRVEDLDQFDAASLYDSYVRLLQQASIDVYIVGDTTLDKTMPIVQSLFRSTRAQAVAYETKQRQSSKQVEEREVIEQLEVSQGKLNIGLRANVSYVDDAYPAALVYNGILGGYPHSKLFINVREKESLAYYASSRYDGHKGLLMIQTGIEIANKNKAENIIRQQLDDMRQGRIDHDELSKTKAMIVNQLNEMDDSAFEQMGYHFNTVLANKNRTKQDLIESVQQVDVADVVDIAQGITIDTVYFLRDRQGGNAS